MKPSGAGKRALRSMVLAIGLIAATQSQATDIDSKAAEILKGMSEHLAKSQRFSMTADIDFEVVPKNAQKLQLSASADVMMHRPDKLRVHRRGGFADVEIISNGNTLLLYGHELNAFARLSTNGTVDDAILTYEHETGVPAPGADLLSSDPLAVLNAGLESGYYVGTAYIDGVPCHHLAFRERDTDWQIWVRAEGEPLPMKYIITSTWQTGAPQYSLRLREWNTNPTFDSNTFAFEPPKGAMNLQRFTVDEFGQVTFAKEGE